jgi:3-oxoacyl-[acyl-carrier-protein] synthase-3
MIGINAVATYSPDSFIDNVKQGKKFEHDLGFIKKRLGPLKLPIIGEDECTSDMALKSFNKLIKNHDINKDLIEIVAIVTQNPDGEGLPHASAIFHEKSNLGDSVAVFDISLGCSGYVYGLSIIKSMMKECGMKHGVLITADPYSKVIDRDDRTTSLLFGDASSATYLTDTPIVKIDRPSLCSRGSGWKSLYISNGTIKMNGRDVYDFARKEVPNQINSYMSKNNLNLDDIDMFIMHQGSSAIIDAIKSKYPGHEHKFINNLEEYGNTVSSSIPIALQQVFLNDNSVNNVIISGFGVGLSWATTKLSKIIQ